MIVLLTGKPGVGKSTALQTFLEIYEGLTEWTITKEIRDTSGNRVGFRAVNEVGQDRIIAHKTDIISDKIAGQSKVDSVAVDVMFAAALRNVLSPRPEMVYVLDEIGPIQLFSDAFARMLHEVFQTEDTGDLLATIHATDARLEEYRHSNKAHLFVVTPDNRDRVPQLLTLLARNKKAIQQLTASQAKIFWHLLDGYFVENQSIQFNKLLNNALLYVVGDKVEPAGVGVWQVTGNHDIHMVQEDGEYICDCDLYLGKNQYAGKAGECSHIQAVKIHAAMINI